MTQGQIQQLKEILDRCVQYTTFDSDEDAADIVADMERVLRSVFD